MWASLRTEISAAVAAGIRKRFEVDHDPIVETPPRRELGDFAFPAPLHLARVLKRSPRQIAAELADGLELPPCVREVTIAGAGYLNVFLHRSQVAARIVDEALLPDRPGDGKTIVEHTNINPNKAAHIGHLRNAVLGDILIRTLRSLGRDVEVQNYIDDTGVQVADVVVGFIDLRGMSFDEVEALPEPFDYFCWDLYAEVGRWYEHDEARKALRRSTLHELESGAGERARMGRLIARRVVTRHLATMARLGIDYDLLTHESDILGLDFFVQAFEQLKEHEAIRLEDDGKNVGCWVMPLAESEEFAGLEDPDKVIVRSDGTVTYVGKDIAYQLWKFGLLGRDFGYRSWDEELWETTSKDGSTEHPPFGSGARVVNVIDIRQSYLQKIVKAGLEALDYHEQAAASIHFAYEMVALSPATARQLGVASDDDEQKAMEMSGRRGIGVKADDLIDQLVDKSRDEIATRNRDLAEDELEHLATQIATAAMRFFMVKVSTNRVIAFDFEEALSFEGDSGPYLQYALVRASNIKRKLVAANLPDTISGPEIAALPEEAWSDDLWDLALTSAQIGETAEKATSTLELSLLARHALDLAQGFNAFYHRHPILHEEDATLRAVRLATTQIFVKSLTELAGLLGVPVPERM